MHSENDTTPTDPVCRLARNVIRRREADAQLRRAKLVQARRRLERITRAQALDDVVPEPLAAEPEPRVALTPQQALEVITSHE